MTEMTSCIGDSGGGYQLPCRSARMDWEQLTCQAGRGQGESATEKTERSKLSNLSKRSWNKHEEQIGCAN